MPAEVAAAQLLYFKAAASKDALNVHSDSALSSVKHCASLREVCVSTVHSPVKRLLVGWEWMEGGDGKWSELFPFPQPVYGNIMGARFGSHGGGKDSGRKSERKVKEGARERRRRRDWRNAAFSYFLWKRPCSVCVLHCVVLPLAKATKASIYLSWASNLIERRLWKAGSHHVCQSDMAFPLLTL